MPETAQTLLLALVADGRISQQQADAVMTESLAAGTSVEDILRQKRTVTESDLAHAKAKALNVPFVTLAGRAIAPDIVNYIPEAVARRYVVLPFQFDASANELSVAMIDPLDFQVIEFLEK